MKAEERGHSRLAFFDVCLLVAASEGEELVVDVRHVGGGVVEFPRKRGCFHQFWVRKRWRKRRLEAERRENQGRGGDVERRGRGNED